MTLSTELLKKIKLIQLRADVLATDLLAGLYRSVFKGKGMEFEEVREYQPGDDTAPSTGMLPQGCRLPL